MLGFLRDAHQARHFNVRPKAFVGQGLPVEELMLSNRHIGKVCDRWPKTKRNYQLLSRCNARRAKRGALLLQDPIVVDFLACRGERSAVSPSRAVRTLVPRNIGHAIRGRATIRACP